MTFISKNTFLFIAGAHNLMIAIVLFANLGLQEVNGGSEIKNKVATIGAGMSNVERTVLINGQEWKCTPPNREFGKSYQDLKHIIKI